MQTNKHKSIKKERKEARAPRVSYSFKDLFSPSQRSLSNKAGIWVSIVYNSSDNSQPLFIIFAFHSPVTSADSFVRITIYMLGWFMCICCSV